MKLNAYLFKQLIKNKVKIIGKAFLRRPEYIMLNIPFALEKMVQEGIIHSFIQVGSNDGQKNDPIRPLVEKFKCKGILVEPFIENFNKLLNNYNSISHSLIFEQTGISDKEGILDFYFVKDINDSEPDWYDQIGSFDKETFMKNIEVVPALLDRIGVQKISCTTIDKLLEKHHFNHIDLIHIDAEGYDFRILKSINYEKCQAQAILFETDWMTQYELKESRRLLNTKGYKIYFDGIDCIAIAKDRVISKV